MGRKPRGRAGPVSTPASRRKDAPDQSSSIGRDGGPAHRRPLPLASCALTDATSEECDAAYLSAIEASIAQRLLPADAAPVEARVGASPRVLRGMPSMLARSDAPCVDVLHTALESSALDAAVKGMKCGSCRTATQMAYTLWRRRTAGYSASAHDFPYSHTIVRAWIDLPVGQWERLAGMTGQRAMNADASAAPASQDWFVHLRGRCLQAAAADDDASATAAAAGSSARAEDAGHIVLDAASLVQRSDSETTADLSGLRALLTGVWREAARAPVSEDDKRAQASARVAAAGRARMRDSPDELVSAVMSTVRDLVCARSCLCAVSQYFTYQGFAKKLAEMSQDVTLAERIISSADASEGGDTTSAVHSPSILMSTLLFAIGDGPIPDLDHVAAQLAALDTWYDSNAVRATEFEAAEALFKELQALDARYSTFVQDNKHNETSTVALPPDADVDADTPVARLRALLKDTHGLEAQLQAFARCVWGRVVLQRDRVPSGAARAVAPHLGIPPLTCVALPAHDVPFFADAALSAPDSLTHILRYVAEEHATLRQCEVALTSLRERDATFRSQLHDALTAQRDAIAAADHTRAAALTTAFRSTDAETASLEVVGLRLRLDAQRQMLDAAVSLMSKDQEGSDDVLTADLRDVGPTSAPTLARYTYARTAADAFSVTDRPLLPGAPPPDITSAVDAFDDVLLDYLMRGVVLGTVMLRKHIASLLCAPIVAWYREAAADAAREELLLELEQEAATFPAKASAGSSVSSGASRSARATAGTPKTSSTLTSRKAGELTTHAPHASEMDATPPAAVEETAATADSMPVAPTAPLAAGSATVPSMPTSRGTRAAARAATTVPVAAPIRKAPADVHKREVTAAVKPVSSTVPAPSTTIVTVATAPPASEPVLTLPAAHVSPAPLLIPTVHWDAIQRGDAASVAAYAWELRAVPGLLSEAAQIALRACVTQPSPAAVTLSSLAASLGFNPAHVGDGVHAVAGAAAGPVKWCGPSSSAAPTDWPPHGQSGPLLGSAIPTTGPTRAWVDSLLLNPGDAVSSPARADSEHRWATLSDMHPDVSQPPQVLASSTLLHPHDAKAAHGTRVEAAANGRALAVPQPASSAYPPMGRRAATPSTELTDSSGERAPMAGLAGLVNPFAFMLATSTSEPAVNSAAMRAHPRVRRASTSRLGDAWSAGTGDADVPPAADFESVAVAASAMLASSRAPLPPEHDFMIERALGASPPVFTGGHATLHGHTIDASSLNSTPARSHRATNGVAVAISAPSPFEDVQERPSTAAGIIAGTWLPDDTLARRTGALFTGGGLLPSMDGVGDGGGFLSQAASPQKASTAARSAAGDAFIPVAGALSPSALPYAPASRVLPSAAPLPLVGTSATPGDAYSWPMQAVRASWAPLDAASTASGDAVGVRAGTGQPLPSLFDPIVSVSGPVMLPGAPRGAPSSSHTLLFSSASGGGSAQPHRIDGATGRVPTLPLSQPSILWGFDATMGASMPSAPMATSLLTSAIGSPSPVDATLFTAPAGASAADSGAYASRWGAPFTPTRVHLSSQPPLPATAPPGRTMPSISAAQVPMPQHAMVGRDLHASSADAVAYATPWPSAPQQAHAGPATWMQM